MAKFFLQHWSPGQDKAVKKVAEADLQGHVEVSELLRGWEEQGQIGDDEVERIEA